MRELKFHIKMYGSLLVYHIYVIRRDNCGVFTFPDFLCDILDDQGRRPEFSLYSNIPADPEISGNDFRQRVPFSGNRFDAGGLSEFLSCGLSAG